MNVCVIGYGHFASIVATVTAGRGHRVSQTDETPHLIRANQITLDKEPGYTALASEMFNAGNLVTALPSVDVYWIAYDVPLDADGAPVIAEIRRRIIALDNRVHKDIPFIVSCQWPVGTIAMLEKQCPARQFVYVMENVRAGHAISDFQFQPAIIAGRRSSLSANVLELLHSLGQRRSAPSPFYEFIIEMQPESAELSKHALNAFIALQIAFVNELGDVASHVSASMHDVSFAMLSDPRVSQRAPLRAGSPFGGGSLKRDLVVLQRLVQEYGLSTPILSSILRSNER